MTGNAPGRFHCLCQIIRSVALLVQPPQKRPQVANVDRECAIRPPAAAQVGNVLPHLLAGQQLHRDAPIRTPGSKRTQHAVVIPDRAGGAPIGSAGNDEGLNGF